MIKYRKDIDGLRAISILSVVLFHAFPKMFGGGYVGVDIFFVISGFLITAIILEESSRGCFSFIKFYQKRIVRLFPALIVVLVSSIVVGWFYLFADEFSSLGKHVASGVGFASNFILAMESGYFDTRSELKPFLHLWSLSIEEQFYLVWPALLLFAANRKILLPVLLLMSAASFGLNCFLLIQNQTMTFYWPFTRAWELLIGASLVFFQREYRNFGGKGTWSDIQAVIGICFIGISVVYFKDASDFPGWKALLPCFGTSLLLMAGEKAWFNRLVLSNSLMTKLGQISYPWYLWHWPIISFGIIIFGQNLGRPIKLALVTISFFLAIFTHRLVEVPLKTLYSRNSQKVTAGLVLAFTAVGVFGLIVFMNKGFVGRYPELERFARSKEAFIPPRSDFCARNYKIELCAVSFENQVPTVALIGDSHANHFYPALSKFYGSYGKNLLLLAKSGTVPLLNVNSLRNPITSSTKEIESVLALESVKTVVLSAFWENYSTKGGARVGDYFYKNQIQDSGRVEETNQAKIFEEGLSRTLRQLTDKKKNVVFLHTIPSLPFYLNSCGIERPGLKNGSETKSDCSFSRKKHAENSSYRTIVDRVLKKFPAVAVFDPADVLCDTELCHAKAKGFFLYSDEHHLSLFGADFFKDTYERMIVRSKGSHISF